MKRNILAAALLAMSFGASFAASHAGAPMSGSPASARAPSERIQACAAASPTMRKTLECAPDEMKAAKHLNHSAHRQAMHERIERETQGMNPEQKRAYMQKLRASMKAKHDAKHDAMEHKREEKRADKRADKASKAPAATVAPAVKSPAVVAPQAQ